jgi:hypothetical protein
MPAAIAPSGPKSLILKFIAGTAIGLVPLTINQETRSHPTPFQAKLLRNLKRFEMEW